MLLAGVLPAATQTGLAPDRVADVLNTKHNFAAGYTPSLPGGDSRDTRAASQNETCVFCHTPHHAIKDDMDGDGTANSLPLWNHTLSAASYTVYSSSTLDSTILPADIEGSSKMCLSCHDGTVAIGAVKIANGGAVQSANAQQLDTVNPDSSQTIYNGQGATTGYTPNIGTDLSNDHPIGVTYDATLTTDDGELQDATTILDGNALPVIGARVKGNDPNNDGVPTAPRGTGAGSSDNITTAAAATAIRRPALPLENGKIQCGTCHDPHLRGNNALADVNIKFLRLHRFQEATPSADGAFNINSDINCKACHKKHGWAQSVHASYGDTVGTEVVYDSAAADERDFPANLPTWKASCMNCHDTHTIDGGQYLLREGATGGAVSAGEQTCYQCHDGSTNVVTTVLKNIQTDFTAGGGHGLALSGGDNHAPLKVGANVFDGGGGWGTAAGGSATTAVTGANGVESQAQLNDMNRHVECADCHNGHRVQRSRIYDAAAALPGWTVDLTAKATHVHEAGQEHSNLASGALRGTWGVEPDFVGAYTLLQGDPSEPATQSNGTDFVTKEYQVCLKCHSSFANTSLAARDVAAEVDHLTGANQSWHPVTGATGRTAVLRDTSANAFVAPFDVAVGTQTLYCSDCHKSSTSGVEGAHGSIENKILAGTWSDDGSSATGQPGTSDHLCFDCHQYSQYGDSTNTITVSTDTNLLDSGFSCATESAVTCPDNGAVASVYYRNLHIAHAVKLPSYACTQCHVKVPHGYANPGLLVDLDGGLPTAPYEGANAVLDVTVFEASGNWTKTNCISCH